MKRSIKAFTAFMLAICIILSNAVFTLSYAQNNTIKLELQAQECRTGYFDVKLVAVSNSGIAGYTVQLNYPKEQVEVLTDRGIENGIDAGRFSATIHNDDGYLCCVFANTIALHPKENTVLFTAHFKVTENAAAETADIYFDDYTSFSTTYKSDGKWKQFSVDIDESSLTAASVKLCSGNACGLIINDDRNTLSISSGKIKGCFAADYFTVNKGYSGGAQLIAACFCKEKLEKLLCCKAVNLQPGKVTELDIDVDYSMQNAEDARLVMYLLTEGKQCIPITEYLEYSPENK